MFDDFFAKYPDYTVLETPSAQVLASYKDQLPAELIAFWQAYGFGIYMDGYLKIVNPERYQSTLNEGYANENNKELVFAVTGLGDFLLWDGKVIRLVDFRHGKDHIIESGDDMSWFFDMDLTEDGYLLDHFKNSNYAPAKVKLGALGFEECYGYVPLLGIGGTEKAENLQKVNISVHISIIAQMLGKIGAQ